MKRVYQNMHTNAVTCSSVSDSPLERYFRRLAHFNKRCEDFKFLVYEVEGDFKRIEAREVYLAKFLPPIFHEYYESEPHAARSEYGRPVLAGGKTCKELRGETWFEVDA